MPFFFIFDRKAILLELIVFLKNEMYTGYDQKIRAILD